MSKVQAPPVCAGVPRGETVVPAGFKTATKEGGEVEDVQRFHVSCKFTLRTRKLTYVKQKF